MGKPLSRKRLIRLDLAWKDLLDLPLSGDILNIDRFRVEVVRGPVSDELLLDQPSSAFGADVQSHWYCRYDAEWAHVDTLTAAFRKDPDFLSVQVLQ